MADADLAAVAQRVFEGVLVPLVMGGRMVPGRPIGTKAALSLAQHAKVLDTDLLSQTQLARVRRARRLVAIDRLEPRAPTGEEMALGAALHDLVQSAHPDLDGTFRRKLPERLLAMVEATLERTPPAGNLAAALSRHTWFARVMEVQRTDTVVSWWTGKATFLGADPPARLKAWPGLRRVTTSSTERKLLDLPGAGGAVDAARFVAVLARWLTKTPLTDLATCARESPEFVWTSETLALTAARQGRTLALRALDGTPAIDAALGRATRRLLEQKAIRPAALAIDLLRERAIAAAMGGNPSEERERARDGNDAAFARAAGALAATTHLQGEGSLLPLEQRRHILAVLDPIARSEAGKKIEALLKG